MAVMFTADGKKIWPSSKSRSSDKTTGIIAGIYDEGTMDAMLLNAIDKASKSLFTGLKKNLDKL